ncbi:hypothetical protein ACFW9F_21595 [Streptomyces sp. NPDC059506]|uniref:hypothetical protein n=1 Tax=unclassified Streptomyces TaxID=2593676 RepID=UPI0015FC6ED3|nr:hypothetical protein [Streptomyces sp. SCUT-3]QMV23395.1 hypothetical protein GQS52_18295 [Streptomyces sp. SCUT-3]
MADRVRKARAPGRFGGALVGLVILALCVMGCGKMDELGYEPEVRDVDVARRDIKEVSSRILDAVAVKGGKVSPAGAGVSICEPDPEHLYVMRHPWSVSGVPNAELERGMENLRERLPGLGWKITEYGRNNSKARSLQIRAEHTEKPYKVSITWARGESGGEPLISVSVTSSVCFRAPEGTDLSGEY